MLFSFNGNSFRRAEKGEKGMQIIDRVLTLLELLSSNNDGYMITEISEKLELPISTVHRILSSLKKHNYIEQDEETKKYKLGLNVLNLAVNLLNNNDVRAISRKHIKKISMKYNNLVFLTLMQNDVAICIDTVESSGNMNFYVKIGSEMPINATASAQAIAAYMKENEVNEILEKQYSKKYTSRTLTEVESVKKKLKQIRETGYAICDEELETGTVAISVPIRDFSKKVIGSITMVEIKLDTSIQEKKIIDLKETAKVISCALGYQD